MKFIIILAVLFSVVLSSPIDSSGESESQEVDVCPDFEYMAISETSTIEEFVLHFLSIRGPPDGICREGWTKIVFDGTFYNYPSVCACVLIELTEEISPENGERCPDWTFVSSSDTLQKSWKKNYDILGLDNLADGWCPSGDLKFILQKEFIDVPNDSCFCVTNYAFYNPE